MDVLSLIKTQIDLIVEKQNSPYLTTVYNHIERAEHYYKLGENDRAYFSDVIYRTNQAYEGSLKEAYKVLAEKTDSETTETDTDRIEHYFSTEYVFKNRVFEQFKNFRQNWRNISAHDYRTEFDSNEAFTALNNITSFVHLLLKQLHDKVFLQETTRLAPPTKLLDNLELAQGSSIDKLLAIIKSFSKNNRELIHHNPSVSEERIISLLGGYISSINDDTIPNYKYFSHNELVGQTDIMTVIDNEQIAIDINKQLPTFAKIDTLSSQFANTLSLLKIKQGILYFTGNNDKPSDYLTHDVIEKTVQSKKHTIHVIKA